VKCYVRFTFSSELATEPIVYNLGMQFRLVTTIYLADITKERGWVVLELEGEEKDIEQGIAWATSKGARVEPVDHLTKD